MQNKIIPSIIAKTQQELNERIRKIEEFSDLLQLDVMDGYFVKTHSLDFDFILPTGKNSKNPNLRYEAQLMVNDPISWIENNEEKGNLEKIDTIIFHAEAPVDADDVIKLIREKNKKPGIGINPETSVEEIKHLILKVDQIVVMTVHPGYYGAEFLENMLEKVKKIRAIALDKNIEVDGSINTNTISKAYNAGANLFVVGSYLQNSDNIQKSINILKQKINIR